MPTSIINESSTGSEDKGKEKSPEGASKLKSNTLPQKDAVTIERGTNTKFNRLLLTSLSIVVLLLLGLVVYQFVLKGGEFIDPIPGEKNVDNSSGKSQGLSKQFENPINGTLFSLDEAAGFKDRKPVAVMVNNYVIARPSAGLSKADVIYEAVAEGGITRLMPVFYSQSPKVVSSIRSARYYFVELAGGYKAHYIHWGAAHVPPCQKEPRSSPKYCPPVNGKVETNPDVDAYTRIVQLGVPNLDGGNYSCDGPNCAFGRDPNKVGKVPLEHTAFIRFPLIFDLAKRVRPQESWQKYVPIVEWKFKDDAPLEKRGDIGLTAPITYNYWDTTPGFDVKWQYDRENNDYIRYQGGVKQVDAENGQELRAKVIIIRFTKQKPVGDKKNHLYHTLVGEGDALIFQDGDVVKAKWTRETHDERDVYTDVNGDQIKFVRGQIWIQLVPVENKVSYGSAVTDSVDETGNVE